VARVLLFDSSLSVVSKVLYSVDAAVGRGGANRRDDVLLVQFFLKVISEAIPDFQPDGIAPDDRHLGDDVAGLPRPLHPGRERANPDSCWSSTARRPMVSGTLTGDQRHDLHDGGAQPAIPVRASARPLTTSRPIRCSRPTCAARSRSDRVRSDDEPRPRAPASRRRRGARHRGGMSPWRRLRRCSRAPRAGPRRPVARDRPAARRARGGGAVDTLADGARGGRVALVAGRAQPDSGLRLRAGGADRCRQPAPFRSGSMRRRPRPRSVSGWSSRSRDRRGSGSACSRGRAASR
jgi:hypothetical protein